MNKAISICALVVGAGLIAAVSAIAPHWLNDSNSFMRGFITHELLSVLGIIVTITLGSAAQIHITFNRIERDAGRRVFVKSRRELHSSSYCLILIFAAALVAVFMKPLIETPAGVAAVNGAGVWLLVFGILILLDITSTIFALKPDFDEEEE